MIGVVIGTRPELIKLRPVCIGLHNLDVPVQIIYTGQHAAIRAEVTELCNKKLDAVLVGSGNNSLEAVGRAIDGNYFKSIVVQGDTDSAVSGALAAAFQRIPVIHVEAGLRTVRRDPIGIVGDDLGNAVRTTKIMPHVPVPNRSPFPEELNRQLISRVASLHLAPTYANERNLVAENVGGRIVITGNPGITAIDEYDLASMITPVKTDRHPFILVTCHRRENWPHIDQLVHELDVVRYQSKHWIVFVKHPNTALYKNIAFGPGFTVSDPQDHPTMAAMVHRATLIVTDSGGLIEEATWMRKRMLCLRAETERPEAQAPLIKSILGCHKDIIAALEQPEPTEGSRYAFGDERSAERCALEIEKFYKEIS